MTLRQSLPNHLLHVLHEHQQEHRCVSDEAMTIIAQRLSLPRTQVEAAVEFYAFFSRKPLGKFDIRFSTCTSCGGASLLKHLCDGLGVTLGGTRADGRVSVCETSCIGMCDHGSSMLINHMPLVCLDDERIEQIIHLIDSDTELEEWPDAWFNVCSLVYREDLMLTTTIGMGEALRIVEKIGVDQALDIIKAADLRGRGGAGFRTALKWKICRETEADMRYVICNADEGEPGTFKDRQLLTEHADALIEGMTLCARIIGAEQGFIYLRGEYRYLLSHLEQQLELRREAGMLGRDILGRQGFNFEIAIVVGAGAYICGEESALIESLEEKAGIPRVRPPFPVTNGYLGKPTVVNNVETLIAAAGIVQHGEDWFCAVGTSQSCGSKLISISGDCALPGIYEYPFGVTIQQVIDDCGAEDVQAVQIGGPSGSLIGVSDLNYCISFEEVATGGSLMVFNRSRDMLEIIRNYSHFFADESCGFCTPCRVGTTLLRNGMDKVCSGHATAYDLEEMKALIRLVSQRSHCGLGATASNPVRDGLQQFSESFEQQLLHQEREPGFDLDGALEEARLLTHRDDREAHL